MIIYFNSSNSLLELAKKIGYKNASGGAWRKLKKVLLEYNLDPNQLTNKGNKSGNKGHSKYNGPLKDIFCANSNISRGTIKRLIISNNLIDYRCDICGNSGVWNNHPLSLRLDHINGINNDNLKLFNSFPFSLASSSNSVIFSITGAPYFSSRMVLISCTKLRTSWKRR